MTTTFGRFQHSAALLCLAAGACISLLSGCDRESAEAKLVKSAAINVHSMTGGGASPAPTKEQDKNFKAVVGSIQPVAQSQASEKGAASLILSSAQTGLGSQPLTQAIEREREAAGHVEQAFAKLSAWSLHRANAQSAAAFDPTEQLAQFAANKSKAAADAQRLTGTRAQVQREVDDLKAKAKAKNSAADAEMASYTALADQAQKSSATAGLSILEQARLIKRKSDQLRKEGGDFEAQASKVEPRLSEIDVELTRLANQQKDLTDAEARVQQRHAAAKQEATEADTAATVLANELDKQVADLTDLRTKALSAAYQSAQDSFGRASASAKAAGTDLRASSKVSEGIAQQTIGDVLFSKARGTASYAQLLEALGNTKGLPNAADYTTKAQASRKEQLEAAKAAAEAYSNAKNAFSSAGGSAEAKERLEKVGQQLEALNAVASGASADMAAALAKIKAGQPAADPSATPTDQPPPAAVASNPEETAIRDVFEKYIAASREGRGADSLAFIYVSNPQVRQLLESSTPSSAANVRLNSATKAKFGKSLQEIVASIPGVGEAMSQNLKGNPLSDLSLIEKLSGASLNDITIAGETATATFEGGSDPQKFIKQNGAWLLNLDSPQLETAAGMMSQMGPRIAAMNTALAKVTDELAFEVEAGKFADEASFSAAFMTKIQQAMMQMMQSQPAPGGG
jgi:hypothetical protein